MPFITQGKTNWKFLLITIVLAIIVGVGALWCSTKKEQPYQPPQIKKPEKIELTEELANKIIDKIVLDTKKYDRERAEFLINDLNNDETSEIIVCLATPSSLSWEKPTGEVEAYVSVVAPTDKNGNYKTIGDFIFNREEDTPFLGSPCVDDVKNLIDIDGDGKKEIIVNLGLLGVSGYAYTILKIDWDLHKLNRIEVRNEEGTIEDYYFVNAATLMHRSGFYWEDLDSDGLTEIVEIYDSRVESENEANLVEEERDNYWKREYVVYKWDGSILNYNKELSDLLTTTVDWKIYKNEEYGFEIKYPNSWLTKEFVSNPNQVFGIIFYEKEGTEKSVDIQIYNSTETIEDFIKKAEELTSIERLSVNNYPAVLLGSEGAMGGSLRIFKGEYTFAISCHSTALEIWKKMFPTFKFIEKEETECEKWRQKCAEEGEDLCGPCGCKNCCSGLVKRDVTYPYRNKNNEVFCLEEMTAYTCVKCGDKLCGKGEDWCICPEDCLKPNPEDLQIFIMPE